MVEEPACLDVVEQASAIHGRGEVALMVMAQDLVGVEFAVQACGHWKSFELEPQALASGKSGPTTSYLPSPSAWQVGLAATV